MTFDDTINGFDYTISGVLPSYAQAMRCALEKTRQWYAEHPDLHLPHYVVDIPDDCPLWSFGLTLMQAAGVHDVLKRERSP